MSLPPLPEPDLEDVDCELWGQNVRADCWFEAKLHAYAAEAVAAEREACALACDSLYHGHIGPQYGEVRYGIAACAAAIRARSTASASRTKGDKPALESAPDASSAPCR